MRDQDMMRRSREDEVLMYVSEASRHFDKPVALHITKDEVRAGGDENDIFICVYHKQRLIENKNMVRGVFVQKL